MKIFLLSFIALYSHLGFASSIPACRLDNTLADEVHAVVQNALVAYGRIGIGISYDEILVNPKTKKNNALNILLVRDAKKSELGTNGCFTSTPYLGRYVSNSDRHSISKSICIARTANEIQCSADALARIALENGKSLSQSYEFYEFMSKKPESEKMADYIIGIEPNLRNNESLFLTEITKRFGSENTNKYKRVILEGVTLQRSVIENHPALFYIFAHELAHIVQGDVGQFNSISNWDLNKDFKKKFSDFQTKICGIQDKSIETASDKKAIKAMMFGFNEYPYSSQSIFSLLSNIRLAVDRLLRWGDGSKEPILDAMSTAPLPMTSESAIKLANQFRCDLFESKNSIIKVPIISGTHPAAPLRMKDVANKLSEMTKNSSNIPNQSTPLPGGLGRLLNDVGAALGELDESYGDAFKMVGDKVCEKQGKALKDFLTQCHY